MADRQVYMKLNATFFLQIINFWVTYSLLSRILLKPFVDYIDKKEEAQLLLLTNLNDQETSLTLLEEEKQQKLVDFKNHIHTRCVLPKPTSSLPESKIVFNVQPEKIDHLTTVIKNILIKAAQYDR